MPKKKENLNTIDGIADAVYRLAWKKGWHSNKENEDAFIERTCNNLHDEISELHEAWRNNNLHKPCNKAKAMRAVNLYPMTCVEEELADIIIRSLDSARKLNINIGAAIIQKHTFNKTRSIRHGGKRS